MSRAPTDGPPAWHALPAEAVLQQLDSRPEGLEPAEAARRLEAEGPNELAQEDAPGLWRTLLHQFKSPLIYVLLVAMVVTLAMRHWSDSIVIGAVLLINAVIGFSQERKAEHAIRALSEMAAPRARVRRGGEPVEVESRTLVPGDVVVLSAGDVVPADVRLIESHAMQVGEAALTGESVPVSKSVEPLADAPADLPPSERGNEAFMSTAVTAGGGVGVVFATGPRTVVGSIAETLRGTEATRAPLVVRLERLANRITLRVGVVSVGAMVLGLVMGRGFAEMFLTAISLAVAAIPEGLPIVVTVALAVGVRRMAKRHAIIRHLPAVEVLGSTTIIVSDKTGTLTKNEMTVTTVAAAGEHFELTGTGLDTEGRVEREGEPVQVERGTPLYYTLLAGALNNEAELPAEDEPAGDPMEVALLVAGAKAGLGEEAAAELPVRETVPFSAERRFSATIHDGPDGPLALVKGAPERILEMGEARLVGEGRTEPLDGDALAAEAEALAGEGLRVLAMAIGQGARAVDAARGEDPTGLTFVGFQGLLDPPRPEAREAVQRCAAAGVRVIMCTGDHARTAAAIAAELGIGRREGDGQPAALTGRELSDLSDEALDRALDETDVFARVQPEQKHRIVQRLVQRGHVVAVTGDGVNDAPALKAAHLGVAMGRTGTDVAKEASGMVVTDDDFASIYAAVEEGRTAFRNIRMATFFLLSGQAGFVVAIVAALAAGWPLLLLPAQILWVNVATNGIQDVALAFEPGEKALFERPPRRAGEGIIHRLLVERLLLVGPFIAAATLLVFWWEWGGQEANLTRARVAAVTATVVMQWFHLFNCRSEDMSVFRRSPMHNMFLLVGSTVAFLVHLGAMYLPVTQRLLSLEPLPAESWLRIVALGVPVILVVELHKAWRRRHPVQPEDEARADSHRRPRELAWRR